jgi:hypothetical protein
MTTKFFAENAGLKTGCEVRLSGTQDEPVVFEMDTSDGLVSRYTYSSRWMEETCDNASILNNFLHLFDFVDNQALLVFFRLPGKSRCHGSDHGDNGKDGVQDRRRLSSARLHQQPFCRARLLPTTSSSRGILDLEQVISWFFEEYLVKEFRRSNFFIRTFRAAGRTLYLQM